MAKKAANKTTTLKNGEMFTKRLAHAQLDLNDEANELFKKGKRVAVVRKRRRAKPNSGVFTPHRRRESFDTEGRKVAQRRKRCASGNGSSVEHAIRPKEILEEAQRVARGEERLETLTEGKDHLNSEERASLEGALHRFIEDVERESANYFLDERHFSRAARPKKRSRLTARVLEVCGNSSATTAWGGSCSTGP